MSAHEQTRASSPARLRSLPSGRVWLKTLCIDFDRFTASLDGRALSLTAMEFDILGYLILHSNRVVSQDELLQQVVHGAVRPDSSSIRVHIANVRRKLGGSADVIRTVRGRGFIIGQ